MIEWDDRHDFKTMLQEIRAGPRSLDERMGWSDHDGKKEHLVSTRKWNCLLYGNDRV